MENNSKQGEATVVDKTSDSPIRRVMKEDEEKSFQDLGLGRGVDATNPTPWLNKRPLQIREVSYGNIIGTEEGNLYQGFVNEVESTQHFQTNLSASVPVNQLVNLGIDSELSRSYSVSQKSVGRKITTRTISFRANFDKLCKESDTQGSVELFEDRLKKWMKLQREEERVKKALLSQQKEFEAGQRKEADPKPQISEQGNQDQQREAQQNGEARSQEAPRRQERGVITLDGETKLNQEECYDLCYKFVSTFSVTHYVHSLELGASHYRVMSLEEYSSKFSSKAKLGVGQLADIAIGNERSFSAKKYKSQTTKVGRMNMKLIADDDDSRHWGISSKKKKEKEAADNKEGGDSDGKKEKGGDSDGKKEKSGDSQRNEIEEEVLRSTIGEAVVGVKLQPISALVTGEVGLRIALQKALQKYIHDRQKVKFGPFYIACNWDQLYLTVNSCKDYEVEATYNIDKASKFYIVRCDEGDNHFYIVHESPVAVRDQKKFEAKAGKVELKPSIPMYLCASVNWRGRSKGNHPVRMRLDGKSTNSRMAIHCRKDRNFTPADLTEWVNEKEIFFINCQERSITTPISSYLCVYESGETGCKPTIESHDDKRKFMLFRLIKLKEEEAKKEVSTPAESGPVEMMKGPFLIKHTRFNQDYYVQIGEENELKLIGPGDRDEPQQFHIKRVSKYNKYFEIVSSDDQKLHLTATVDWRGYGIHPPKLRSDANGRFYMAIYDRKSRPKDMKLEDPSKCGKGNDEAFFISCSTKPAFTNDASYLIVNEKVRLPWSDPNQHRLWIGCAPSIKHNSRNGEPMLFKLVKRERTATPQREVQEDGGSDQESDVGSVNIRDVTAEMHI